VRNLLARTAGWAVENPVAAIAAAVLVALIGAIAALRLEADASTDTLVDSGSSTFEATEEFQSQFGDDPVVILVEGDLRQLLLTEDLGKLLTLEGCLAGQVPEDQEPISPVCSDIADADAAHVVYGPATFLNQFAVQAEKLLSGEAQATLSRARAAFADAVRQARRDGLPHREQKQAGLAAAQEVLAGLVQAQLNLALQYGLTGIPRINDPRYVSAVVFDTRLPGSVPKARFNYLFPSSDSALISVRLRSDLSESEREEAIALFREAAADPAFALENGTYTVSGIPVVVEGLADELSTQIFILLAVALAVMTVALALVFGPPFRLLPLGIALGAAGVSFGVLSLVGGSLTMASIAVLPVLIGLAVDYAIQFHARFTEAATGGSSPARAAVEAAAAGGPVIGTAVLATAAGFIVLLLSPIPMVRGFAVLLLLGVAVAFALALTAGLATLSLVSGAPRRPSPRSARLRAIGSRISRRSPEWPRRLMQASVALAIRAPGRVLAVALVLAVGGWFAGTRINLISDIRELVPRDLPELQNVDRLQEATGVSGEVDVTVKADDLTDPAVISWMKDFKARVLADHGFSGDFPSCRDEDTELCPAIALPDLFGDQQATPSQAHIKQVLRLLPPYFSQAVITRDPETGKPGDTAVIAFGIKVMPFDEQKDLIDEIRDAIDPPGVVDDPPSQVEATVVGLPVLAADANSALSGNRYLMTVAGLLAVAAVLFAVYRSAARALVPLLPIALSTGWSSLVLYATGVPLNPMSATLGALVIAIGTEFSVLLAARYHEERTGGASLAAALRSTYSQTGVAVAASGITAIAGFGTLALAAALQGVFGGDPIRMLTDFGLVGVFNLTVALAGVFLVLPATLVWVEGSADRLPAPVARLRRRLRPATAESASDGG
jgi:hypothetical protein